MFKDRRKEILYRSFLRQEYPLRIKMSESLRHAFNDGYEGKKCTYNKKWLIYAAYAAGRDKAKYDNRVKLRSYTS